MNKQLELHDLKFEKELGVVRQYLDFVMQWQEQSKIQIIPDYPTGWHAIFAANGYVWTLQCDRGFIGLVNVGVCHGVRPNGTLIVVDEPNGLEKAVACQDYFLEYAGDDLLPLCCDQFCDRDEAPCRFCKMVRIDNGEDKPYFVLDRSSPLPLERRKE